MVFFLFLFLIASLSLSLSLDCDFFFYVHILLCVVFIDFNQYYNLGLLKDFERNGAVAAAAFGFGASNEFLSPIKSTTLKPYQSSNETNSITKNPSSNYHFCTIFCDQLDQLLHFISCCTFWCVCVCVCYISISRNSQ